MSTKILLNVVDAESWIQSGLIKSPTHVKNDSYPAPSVYRMVDYDGRMLIVGRAFPIPSLDSEVTLLCQIKPCIRMCRIKPQPAETTRFAGVISF